MPNHANFAASIAIKQSTLQELFKIVYQGNQIPHFINPGLPQFSGNLFLALPVLTLSSSNNNNISLGLRAWGNVSIMPPGISIAESYNVLLRAVVKVPPQVSIANSTLFFGLNGLQATIETYDLQVISTGGFSQAVQAYITSETFKSLLQTGIRFFFSSSQVAPPINVAFLGAIAATQNNITTSIVLDNALAIGLDISEGGITTNGTAQLLTDTTGDNDIAMWINPSAVPVALSDVTLEVQRQVDEQDATLNNFNISISEGNFHFNGRASKTGGTVNFSMDAIPHLIRPGTTIEWDEEYGEHFVMTTPDREELWFEMQNVNVDIERDWWVILLDVLGALLAGIGTIIIESIVSMIRNNISNGIQQTSDQSKAARVQEFTFFGINVQIKIDKYECHAIGQFTGINFRPQFQSAEIRGIRFIPIEDVTAATIIYSIIPPSTVLLDDPQLKIRWTIRNQDMLSVILSTDALASSNSAISLQSVKPQLIQYTNFRIECRVYRTLGSVVEEFFNDFVDLKVYDRIKKNHPYVRWDHTVYTPNVKVDVDGTHSILGYNPRERHSKIHKTRYPGRCLMVSRYSSSVLPEENPDVNASFLEYSDQLPFPVSEILDHRNKLCDYCFFGGPSKNVPLPL